MLKKLLVITLILLINFQGNSQVTDVITNLSSPAGIVINNGKLYVAERENNKVIEFDLLTENSTDFVTALALPTGLIKRADDLLIAEHNGFKISKKDVTLSPSEASDYIMFQTPPFVEPWGIVISEDQNTLYI